MKRHFDLAILDVVMPTLSGEILAAHLRRHDPDLRILYITGYDDALFQARPMLWEGESFLEKPFTPAALIEAVSMALRGGASQSA
jgi:two-component system, cell cycle sensor histidine kinase and response regulator CckA